MGTKRKNINQYAERMRRWINEGAGKAALTLEIWWDEDDKRIKVNYEEDEVGLIMGMVAHDGLLADLAAAGLVKVLAEQDPDVADTILKMLTNNVQSAREIMNKENGIEIFLKKIIETQKSTLS